MTLISWVCFVVLASSASGRSAYEIDYKAEITSQRPYFSNLMQDQTISQPLSSSPDASAHVYKLKNLQRANGLQYYLCRGKKSEAILPLENGRKFVVCLRNGNSVEQNCPKGLYFLEATRRCERSIPAIKNVCASQSCLNGGRCILTNFSYQCQCASDFYGLNCELDACICHTEQPCGQSPSTRCQSFRLGAALPYICIFQDGLAYSLNFEQISYSSVNFGKS
ncbi:unnamed protein product [Rotaria magnacalcarata]|uniref:Uncharacterized protein n=2 Tax=Rotaria magnacalcarata TaxID=392030 RepID=A0A818X7P1_9BILA|nr:unnamed protein product [Rotaria magnacalcarata]